MKEYKFQADIIKHETLDAAYIEFPFDVKKEFGKKGQVKVKAIIDGCEYRGSLAKMGYHCHIIGLNKKVREAIDKKAGDRVDVIITEDKDERTVELPADLNLAFSENYFAAQQFNKLSFSNRKEYVTWIVSAKKQETREARLKKSIQMLVAGKKNPSDKT
ncbi:MAG: YdeI/OmpD-associated family protein [Lentimicrobium sp.]|nr:YdeI/OmpD-associated family protein [Lentimicrobium sp.]